MIEGFRHRGLKQLFEQGDRSRIRPDLVDKIERILNRLDASSKVDDMNVAGFGLHRQKGNLRGFWAVVVSRNWRVVFRFENGSAYEVDFLDYH